MSASDLPQADIGRVVWNSQVYEPSDDSFALVDAVLVWLQQQQERALLQQQDGGQGIHLAELPKRCLEVGCGSGFVICSVALAIQQLFSSCHATACSAAPQGLSVCTGQTATSPAACCNFIATDISQAALEATAATLAAHHVSSVELIQTDLVASLLPKMAGTVDLLLFNPPYVPTPDEEVERDGIARAWAGGHLGRRVTDRLLKQLPELLSPCGHAFIVTVPENKPQDIISMLEAMGLTGVVVLTRAADEECLQILHVWRL